MNKKQKAEILTVIDSLTKNEVELARFMHEKGLNKDPRMMKIFNAYSSSAEKLSDVYKSEIGTNKKG